MYDPLGIANRNIWLLIRPYIIILWIHCVVASMFGLAIATVVFMVTDHCLMAFGCSVGVFFLLIAGMSMLGLMWLADDVETVCIEVHY